MKLLAYPSEGLKVRVDKQISLCVLLTKRYRKRSRATQQGWTYHLIRWPLLVSSTTQNKAMKLMSTGFPVSDHLLRVLSLRPDSARSESLRMALDVERAQNRPTPTYAQSEDLRRMGRGCEET